VSRSTPYVSSKIPNTGEEISMTDAELRAACFLIERKLAKAEAPKELKVSGELTLVEILREAAKPSGD
jgi:hypothetical protein